MLRSTSHSGQLVTVDKRTTGKQVMNKWIMDSSMADKSQANKLTMLLLSIAQCTIPVMVELRITVEA